MSHRILVVDDDPAVLEVLARQLSEYEVTTAASPDEALKAVRRNGLELVIADVRMGQAGDGVALLEAIRRLRPDMVRVILTGYADAHAVAAAYAEGGAYRFKKPWGDELLVAVKRALESREAVLTLRRRVGLLLSWLEMVADLASRRTPEEVLAALGRWLESLPGVSAVDCYVLRSAMLECVHASGRLADVSLYQSDSPVVRCITEGKVCHKLGQKVERIQPVGEAAARGVVRLLADPGEPEVSCLVDQALAVATLALRALRPTPPEAALPEELALRQLQKQAAIGGLFSSIVHEMNNPLGAVLAHLEMLQADRGEDPTVKAHIDVLIPQMERITAILERARKLAHPFTEEFVPLDMRQTMHAVVALLEYHFRSQGVQMRMDLPADPVMILGSASMLHQVWLNLLKNAMEAVLETPTRQGEIAIRVVRRPREIVVTVTDDGIGMSPETLERLRRRPEFFTTKPEGLGLGTYESRRILMQHEATIDYESRQGKGTTVTVRFKPAAAS